MGLGGDHYVLHEIPQFPGPEPVPDVFFQSVVGRMGGELQQMLVDCAYVLVDGDIVVVDYHQQVCLACTRVVESFECQASGKGALLAVYSFNGNKIITSGGGGMLLSDDAGLLARCRKLAQQAREPVPWYEHTAVGTHGRLGNVPAAIGLAQLRHLDDALRDKARVWDLWGDVLAGRDWIRRMPTAPYGVPNRWLTVVTLDGVDPLAAVKVLADAGIESRPLWKPMRLQPVFRGAPVYGTALEENLFAHGLCLPSGRTLDRETVMTVAGLIDKLRG